MKFYSAMISKISEITQFHLLSGGQKQLVAISSVVAMKPDYIVFDEPTTLLDLRNKRRVTQVIEELSQTAIIVSHDLEFLKKFDRVLVFDKGEIVVDDVPFVAIKEYIKKCRDWLISSSRYLSA
ncbi:Biotin transport ATP-binding protein BioM [Bartonella vinsonii]|uniref:Biotin transport ATP-binding protein BioM n=1 Tax=Bartonella vinsonii TaxID=33047 RepID=A0A448V3N6_BARVI|nr:Biotin transport ATP-binding protein BioM [Bartonella vinsonii]